MTTTPPRTEIEAMAERLPRASGDEAKNGWTLSFAFLERARKEAIVCATLEEIEAILLFAESALASATPVPPDAIAWLDRMIEKYRLAPEGAHARAIREALNGTPELRGVSETARVEPDQLDDLAAKPSKEDTDRAHPYPVRPDGTVDKAGATKTPSVPLPEPGDAGRVIATAVASLRDMATGNIADPVINRAAMRRIANRLERISASPDAERIAELEAFHREVWEAFRVTECCSKPRDIVGLWQDWATASLRAESAEAEAAKLRAIVSALAVQASRFEGRPDGCPLSLRVEMSPFVKDAITVGDLRALSAEAKPEGGA